MAADGKVPVNLALQGGGAHGAFTWGVLDRLLEEEWIDYTAISGTSAGAMNAIVMAEGLIEGDRAHARAQLEQFWLGMADAAALISPFRRTPWQKATDNWALSNSFLYEMSLSLTRMFSPYELNPFGYNPLKDALVKLIDFEKVRRQRRIKLFINTTHVRTGGLRCWREHELTVEMVLASACLPWLFHTPIIEGEGYWDGGYIANPAIEPMVRCTGTDDALIVQLNPIVRNELPRSSYEIHDRLNEITFNASLLMELRVFAERNRLIDAGELTSDRYRKIRLHMIHGDEALGRFPPSTKLLAERDFLLTLKEAGRTSADAWLAKHGAKCGKRSSFNYGRLVDQLTQETDENPDPRMLMEEDGD
jgi:NTE family protein